MSFVEELKQRKVIRVAMAYPVLAWLAVQVLSIVLPAFEAPAWTLWISILVIALGYPLVLAFTWILQLTPDGLRLATSRAGDRRMLVIATLLVALALLGLPPPGESEALSIDQIRAAARK